MWLPQWLYDRLPLAYLLCAALCLWFLGTSFAASTSALLLVAAAITTHHLRRQARLKPAKRPGRRTPANRR